MDKDLIFRLRDLCLKTAAEAADVLEIYQNYGDFVYLRCKEMPTKIEDVLHAAVGVSGEAGELLDAVKKTWIYNKPLDLANVKEELGDLLFYIQAMANLQGWTLQEILQANIEKLHKRYPNGYSDKAAQKREDKEKDSQESWEYYCGGSK